MVLPVRKHPRLKAYDYSQTGCYHITICVKDRRPLLSRILPAANSAGRAQVLLSRLGEVVEHYLRNIPEVYTGVQLVKYVVMPNHVHLLLLFDPRVDTSVPTVIRSLKRMVNRTVGQSLWQDSYYDVIVRNDSMFQFEWTYIDNNPDKWIEDELYVPDLL